MDERRREAEPVPALVTVHLWGVPARHVPTALLRMGLDRRVRRLPGVAFAKLLGTGAGLTFTPRDADPLHWGLLATWRSEQEAYAFEDSPVARGWAGIAQETLRVRMRPLRSRGRWSGREPFGREPFGAPAPHGWDGRVAAVTRARLRTRTAVTFWRAVPPVTAELQASPGLELATGIGEAPVGLQGTFSLWESARALTAFAHAGPRHVAAVRRTAQVGWYAEELFARFAVLDVRGSFAGARWDDAPRP